MELGERVGAISGHHRTWPFHIWLYGYGVYEGDFPHAGTECNPRLRLDDGSVIWGTECWWGTESTISMICKHDTVETVDVETELASERGRHLGVSP